MKKNQTRRALLMSALSLLLCCSMLIGTTFAWFTDTVESGKNQIIAGNLDVELEYARVVDGEITSWAPVANEDEIFDPNALWEPGRVEVVYLKVSNLGTLALKYQLGVNVYKETPGISVETNAEFKLSEHLVFKVVSFEQEPTVAYTRKEAMDEAGTEMGLKDYNSNVLSLDAKGGTNDEDYLALIVYMPESVGNEANYRGTAIPTIELGVNLFATQFEAESDSFDKYYDKNAIIVTTAAEAQAALDNAEPGATIKLAPGVDYGTLKFRANPGHSNTTLEDIADAWRYNYTRIIENVTIIGATGAKVDGIIFETGAQPGDCNNRAVVKNLVIDGVEFTDALSASAAGYNAPIMITTSNATVDGLTVKNCKLIGDNSTLNLVYFYGADGSKNVTLTGNTVDGIARLCELRGTENVTITNNVVKNTYEHGVLLAGSGYSGNVVISNNIFDGVGSIGNVNVVRMAGAANANVIISNNTATSYFGGRDDFAKVDGGTPVIENNTMSRGYKVSDVTELKSVLSNINDGDTVYLAAVNFGGVDLVNTTNGGHRYHSANFDAKNVTIVGQNGTTFSTLRLSENDDFTIVMTGWTFENIAFTGAGLRLEVNNKDTIVKNCSFNDTELMAGSPSVQSINLTVEDCAFNGSHATRKTQLFLQNSNGVTVTGCTFTNGLYNAMALSDIRGNVTIKGNTINGTADRAFRISGVGENIEIAVKNNTITDSARVKDGKNQVICIGDNAGVPATSSITFTGNTYDGAAWAEGMVIENTAVETIICSDNTRIDG